MNNRNSETPSFLSKIPYPRKNQSQRKKSSKCCQLIKISKKLSTHDLEEADQENYLKMRSFNILVNSVYFLGVVMSLSSDICCAYLMIEYVFVGIHVVIYLGLLYS